MSTHKKLDVICVVVILLALVLTILFMNGEKLGLQKVVDEDSPYYEGTEYVTSNDLNGDWGEDSATAVITLEGDTAAVRETAPMFWMAASTLQGAGNTFCPERSPTEASS